MLFRLLRKIIVPKISICVPVYTMPDGLSEKLLVEFLSHLVFQSFRDFDIVISDQSEFDNLQKVCDTFSNTLDIKYHKNTSGIKTAANNVNNATSNASGEIIKLLYMDDFFVNNQALDMIYQAFQSSTSKWLICGFTHCDMDRTKFYDTRTPWYGNKYVNGDNTTGNPSTYAVRKECLMKMDENLLWLVDGEYFYRSYFYYGDPIIIPTTLVAFREHKESAFLKPEFRELDTAERLYCEEKYHNLINV